MAAALKSDGALDKILESLTALTGKVDDGFGDFDKRLGKVETTTNVRKGMRETRTMLEDSITGRGKEPNKETVVKRADGTASAFANGPSPFKHDRDRQVRRAREAIAAAEGTGE